jgi:transcriptional regulator with XRE-family HTH domain
MAIVERRKKIVLFPKQALAFGNRLTQLRVLKGYSQVELSAKANINRCTLNQIEKGKMNPEFETQMLIFRALEISPGQFMFWGDLLDLVE